MNRPPDGARRLPPELAGKINSFRSQLRVRKCAEAAWIVSLMVGMSFLCVFALDRWIETPNWVRAILFLIGAAAVLIMLPAQLIRWFGGTRSVAQVARVIGLREPEIGDLVLGVAELTSGDSEYAKSPELCAAAIEQVNEDISHRDLMPALPQARSKAWAIGAMLALSSGLLAGLIYPDAAANALARLCSPFSAIERYTFVQIDDHSDEWIVAKGENYALSFHLLAASKRRPQTAQIRVGGELLDTGLEGSEYRFELPPCSSRSTLELSIGDLRREIVVLPVDRPEMEKLELEVHLPEYLGIVKPRLRDGRSGGTTVVEGSLVRLHGTITRALTEASWNGDSIPIIGAEFRDETPQLNEVTSGILQWRDLHGLSGSEPFTLSIRTRSDTAPKVHFEGLKAGTVMLSTETLPLTLRGSDDLGVSRMGISWIGVKDIENNPSPAIGQKALVVSEDADTEASSFEGGFSPTLLGIKAQQLQLRAWILDALPGRARVESSPVTLHILTPEEHMIWLTQRLGSWREESDEVRDREVELHQINQALRRLTAAELDLEKNRKRLSQQARAERSNGRRLEGLVSQGHNLVNQAARNPEFNADTLNDWANLVATMDGIAKDRMPSVADLLAKAAKSPPAAPSVGVNRGQPSASSGAAQAPKLPGAPTVMDVESSLADPADAAQKSPNGKTTPPPPPSRLTLAQTILKGKADGGENGPDDAPAEAAESISQAELDRALAEQKKLLAALAKVSGELEQVLRNLEGSTFVKRFKAQARSQIKIAKGLETSEFASFGADSESDKRETSAKDQLAQRELRSSERLSLIQEDLGGLVTRLEGDERQSKYDGVLQEMKSLAAVGEVRDLAGDVTENLVGDASTGAEFWADTMDRWAEQLVGPG